MSTLYKRKDSRFLWYRTAYRGRRIRISTGTSHRKTATRIQNDWDYRIAQGDTSFFELDDTITDIEGYVHEHLNFLSGRKSEGTVTIAKGVLTKFKVYLAKRGVRDVSSITVKNINGYLDALDRSSKTKKNHLGVISRMMKQCVIEDIIDRNPCDRAEAPRIIKKEKHRLLKTEDLTVIFKEKHQWWLYYCFLLYTGLRAGDVAMLKYEDIDLNSKRLTHYIRKSKRTHELPLSTHIVNALGEIKGRTGPIFPELYTEKPRQLNDRYTKARKFLQALLEEAERPKANLHSFRVTYNNMLRDIGLDIHDRQVLLAHTASETTKIYTHPNPELAEKYLNGLPDYISGESD